MQTLRNPLAWTIAAVLCAACGDGVLTEQPVGGALVAPGDGGRGQQGAAFLSIEGFSEIAVPPSSRFAVAVSYHQADSTPVPGVEVRFWLDGEVADASLVAATASTDDAGRVQMELVAASDATTFLVGVGAAGADDVWLTVHVDAEAPPPPEPDPDPPVGAQQPHLEGRWTVVTRYDLTASMGAAGERIGALGSAFADPGAWLAGFIHVDGFVGGLVQGIAGDLVNGLIAEGAPAWLQGAVTLGDDVNSLLTDLKVTSTLDVSKVQADGTFQATHRWDSLAFQWALGCPPGVEGCGDNDLPLAADGEPVGLTGATAAGRVTLSEHPLGVDVGPVAAEIVTRVVLPARVGQDSFAGMLSELVDCAALGAAGEQEIGVPFSADAIAAGCVAGLAEAAGSLQSELEDALSVDLGNQAGEARLVDGDANGTPEAWADGVWSGVNGRFHAEPE